MKITPLEIRQKTFERTLRGYDKDEVNAFLLSLSQEWERMMDEVKEVRQKLESSEREVGKLREVETSLFKTLKTAIAGLVNEVVVLPGHYMGWDEMNPEGIFADTLGSIRRRNAAWHGGAKRDGEQRGPPPGRLHVGPRTSWRYPGK